MEQTGTQSGTKEYRRPMAIFKSTIALALLCAVLTCRGERVVVSLDGKWDFQLDPQDAGCSGQWFAKRVAFTNTILVPGAWQAQGYGKDGDKLRHNYEGKAWYKRQVRLPRLAPGQRLFLCVGGVHRSAEVWVNGDRLGEHIGYPTAFRFDITRMALYAPNVKRVSGASAPPEITMSASPC